MDWLRVVDLILKLGVVGGSTETLDRLQSQIKETLTALGLDKHVIGVQLQSNVSAHVNFVSQVQVQLTSSQNRQH